MDNNNDGDFCDVSIPPQAGDDGPFSEGQPLGNVVSYGGCEAFPDPAPGDGTYTVTIDSASDECSIYNDFGYKPPEPACDLTVEKGCQIPPPAAPDGKCEGKLQQFTMV